MTKRKSLVLLSISCVALVSIAGVVFSKSSSLVKAKATSNDYTLVLNNSNGGLTNSDYSSVTNSVTAKTTSGNDIVLRYKYGKKTEIDSDGYGYDSSTGLCSLQYYQAHSGYDAYYYKIYFSPYFTEPTCKYLIVE